MLNSVNVRLGRNGLYSVEARSDTVPKLTYAILSSDDIIPGLIMLGLPEQRAVDLIAHCQDHLQAVYTRQVMPLSGESL
jgi:hypothetical protein